MSALYDVIVFVCILTPSSGFVVFVYWPAVALFLVYCRINFGVYNDEELVTIEYTGRCVALMVFATVVFYLL